MSLPATEGTVGGILIAVGKFVNFLGLGAGSSGSGAGGWGIGSIGCMVYFNCKITIRKL